MNSFIKPFLLLTAIALGPQCLAQAWTQKADLPGMGRSSAVGFSIGTKGYIGTGETGGNPDPFSDFWEFDPTTNAWAQKADFGGGMRSRAVGFSIGSKGYIGTGEDAASIVASDFWEYDPVSNAWTQKANFGGGPRFHAIGFSIGTKGYLGTGMTPFSVETNDFWEYDPGTDTWTQKANVGGPLRRLAVGFSIGAQGYIGTGKSGNFALADMWAYDPSTNIWSQLPDFPGGPISAAPSFAIGGSGYVVYADVLNDESFWEYDPVLNAWIHRPIVTPVECTGGVGFCIGAIGYVGTGTGPPGAEISLWAYDPSQSCVVGAPCDDGNACTLNDTINNACLCSGTPQPDPDNDGLCGANDPCPFLPFVSIDGEPCDDGDPCTANDTVANCECHGTPLPDSDGDLVCDLIDACPLYPLNNGSSCDDFNACTENDVVTNCICAGTPLPDGDGDGICDAMDPCDNNTDGQPCDGGNPCRVGATLQNCLCIGGTLSPDSDGDGTCDVQDDCPNTPGVENGPCDDGDPCTLGEFLTNCICGGGTTSPDNDGDGTCDALDNDWLQVSDISIGRTGAVGFSIGAFGYIATGSELAASLKNDLWQYDPTTDSWTQMADFPGTHRYQAAGFAMLGKGYLGTGYEPGGTNDFYEYDPGTNAWTQKASFGGTARGGAVGFAISTGTSTLGYIGTGNSGSLEDDLWAYDPVADTWTEVAAHPFGGRTDAVGFAIGDKGYFGTGYSGGPFNIDFWEYDPTLDTWTQKSDFGGGQRTSAVGFVIGATGYIGSGYINEFTKDLWAYDPSSDIWTRQTDLPGSARSLAACFAIGTKGYVGTGYDGANALADLWEFSATSCSVGASCDDGLLCTINDVYGVNCNCAGTPVNDADGDGVCDENDLCTGTPTGELVNTAGCSCSQQTLDDGIPCTVDACTDGIVTHTLLDGDADLDGVCDGADACPTTPTGETVNAFGCACSEQTVDDGDACTADDCLNGVVTHTFIDADADGVCDTNDACPGTASGAAVGATGCACAQLPTVCFDDACAAGPLVVGVNGPYSNVAASVQAGEPQPPVGSCTSQMGWCSGQAPSHSVWFSFVAPPSGKISLNFGTTNTWDSQIALWSAPDCNSLLMGAATLVAANDDFVGTPPYPYDAAIAPVCVTPGATYYVQVDGYGATTFENFQLVLVEEATPNCDDGIACTVDSYDCGSGQCVHIALPDSDNDGLCDAVDPCPLLANLVNGNTCDDGNACTINDVVANCACAGTSSPDTDSDGLCDAVDPCPLLANLVNGNACDDGNACTINDVVTNCACAGTVLDSDNDGVCDANDNCPNVVGQIGSPCDDGNANTTNDVLNANCVCAGIPVGCSILATLEIGTDGMSTTTWEVRQQGTDLVQLSGGTLYGGPATVVENLCLPNGCYYLRVMDDAGDGITGGGYVLKSLGGQRIIDNTAGFGNGSVSAIANNEGFCLPMGTFHLDVNSCDRMDLRRGVFGTCSDKIKVYNTTDNQSKYQYWFFDPNGSFSFKYPAMGSALNTVNLATLPELPEGMVLNARVRKRATPNTWGEWGPACRIKIDNARGQCAMTKLEDVTGANLSCGQTKALGGGTANRVYAKPKTRFNTNCTNVKANKYQFRFRIPNEGVVIVKNGSGANAYTQLNAAGLVATPIPANATLQPCKTYQVEVRVSFDGGTSWCIGGNPYTDLAPWGDECTLYTAGCSTSILMEEATITVPGTFTLYPNPNKGDQLMLSLSDVEEGVRAVRVDIHDLFGKRVSLPTGQAGARTIAVADGTLNTVIDLNGELAAGMYVVNITAGTDIRTERLVIAP